jgi:hypothetical protein
MRNRTNAARTEAGGDHRCRRGRLSRLKGRDEESALRRLRELQAAILLIVAADGG